MAYNITISVTKNHKEYLENNGISPSELMRKAIELQMNGEILSNTEYEKQIEVSKKVYKALQEENQRLYDELNVLKVLK